MRKWDARDEEMRCKEMQDGVNREAWMVLFVRDSDKADGKRASDIHPPTRPDDECRIWKEHWVT